MSHKAPICVLRMAYLTLSGKVYFLLNFDVSSIVFRNRVKNDLGLSPQMILTFFWCVTVELPIYRRESSVSRSKFARRHDGGFCGRHQGAAETSCGFDQEITKKCVISDKSFWSYMFSSCLLKNDPQGYQSRLCNGNFRIITYEYLWLFLIMSLSVVVETLLLSNYDNSLVSPEACLKFLQIRQL